LARSLNQPRLRAQHIADLFEPRAKGIVEQMGIALRGLNLRMTEKFADHRQRHASGNEQRREGVAQVVGADGGQFGLRPVIFPKPLDGSFLARDFCRKPATVKRFYYEDHEHLRQHLDNFISAYNFGRRVKTLKGLTPYEFICKVWTIEPERFILNPIHQMPRLNSFLVRL
jgi:hypothetical protein